MPRQTVRVGVGVRSSCAKRHGGLDCLISVYFLLPFEALVSSHQKRQNDLSTTRVEIGSPYDGAINDKSLAHDQMSPSFDVDPEQEAQMARYQDLESQSETPKEASNAVEYSVSMTTKAISLVIYFLLSLGLTIQSKMLLGKVRRIHSQHETPAYRQ